MSIPAGRLNRDQEAYRENPTDGGVDRRVADLDGHSLLEQILSTNIVGAEYTKITVTQKNSDGDPEIIEFRNALNVLVRTITITYDSDGDFQEMVKS